ncbi:hypothetical protein MTO96_034256 [Rhipicephalus appendiculatus]
MLRARHNGSATEGQMQGRTPDTRRPPREEAGVGVCSLRQRARGGKRREGPSRHDARRDQGESFVLRRKVEESIPASSFLVQHVGRPGAAPQGHDDGKVGWNLPSGRVLLVTNTEHAKVKFRSSEEFIAAVKPRRTHAVRARKLKFAVAVEKRPQ